MIFPRLVYKSASAHMLVSDIEEYDIAIEGDWFDSVPDAIIGKKKEVVEDAPPTRSELEQKATELKLKFDGRTADAKLARLIAEAIG